MDETTGRLPDQYIPQGVIDLQGDLEQAVTGASSSATAASQSASQAQSSATAADSSARAASASSESARTASDSATLSKDAAAQSASQASASASAAKASETNAVSSATAAKASETNAASSASAAASSETNAAASATAAQQAVDGFGLEVGTTTTGEPGTDATVSIAKHGTKYVANFTIPRGEAGPNVSETVFSIQKPEVTAGKVVEQKRYSRYNRPAWMWNFNTKAKISMKNVNVHASDSDKVWLWIYFSQSALTPTNSTDGDCELLVDGIKIGGTIYNAYRFTAGWNYLEIPINDGGDHTVEINFSRVRGDYTIALDTFEVNYIPKVKPQILLSFDDAKDILTDNRWTLVNKYGFVATFANPDDLASNQEGLYEAFSRGWDWALYGGIDSTVSRPDYDNGSVDDWERYLQTRIEKCEEIGLFEPFTYFSPKNRGSSAIEQALRNLGFKMARISGANTDNITWFDDYNMLYMQDVDLMGSMTSSQVLKRIDNAIGKNSSIVIFTHKVEDSLSGEWNTTVAVYTEMLEGIKQRVDKGLCEVSNFTDFFRKWCPESCEQKMRIREIKEHNYIMKKISNGVL